MSRYRTDRRYHAPTVLEVACSDCRAKRGEPCRDGALCGARTLRVNVVGLHRYYLPKKRERRV